MKFQRGSIRMVSGPHLGIPLSDTVPHACMHHLVVGMCPHRHAMLGCKCALQFEPRVRKL